MKHIHLSAVYAVLQHAALTLLGGLLCLPGLFHIRAHAASPGLMREAYTNVPGLTLSELTNSAKFASGPDVITTISAFETPSQFGDNYGERIYGYLTPPVTGDYVFYIASDDQGALYLSPGTNAGNKVQIATESFWSFPRSWTGIGAGRLTAENISWPIRLEAGRPYYIEALHKEGFGGDNFGVAWQMPGESAPPNGSDPIPAQYLSRELEPATFELAFFTSKSAAADGVVFKRSYNLNGPSQGTTLLPGMRVVPDNSGRYYFAAHPHEAIKVDSKTGTAISIQPGPTLPELSWPMGMAYDSTRNRALLVSLGGEGFLYAYDPSLSSWSVVSSMNNYDLGSIVYHPGYDALFGIGAFGGPYFYRFSPSGAYQSEFWLNGMPYLGAPNYQAELVPVGQNVVLLMGPDPNDTWGQLSQDWYMYLIDPVARTYRQLWRGSHSPPNQAPTVAVTQPTAGIQLPINLSVQLIASAGDSDGTVSTVEFFVDSASVGRGTYVPGSASYSFTWTPPALGEYKIQALATDNDGMVALSSPVRISITPPGPILTWRNPGTITYGMALDGGQLNATANISGTFSYSPPAGTVLSAGNHVLWATFTPSDATIPPASTNVTLHVNRARLSIAAQDQAKRQGEPNPALTASYYGLVAGDTPESLDKPLQLTTTATIDSPPGLYPIVAIGAADANYDIVFYNGILRIRPPAGSPGRLDLTFDPAGETGMLGLAESEVQIWGMHVQSDGKAVIGGEFVGVDGKLRVGLARLTEDGSLDTEFNPPDLFRSGAGFHFLEQPDHKIIVSHAQHIQRLNSDGSLDTSFNLDPQHHGGVLLLQPDGKIVIAGSWYYDQVSHPAYLGRINPDGSNDPTFERRTVPYVIRALALTSEGKILAGGGPGPNGFIRRYNTSGSDDTSMAEIRFGEGNVEALSVLPDGKFLACGTFGYIGTIARQGVVRMNANGTLDTTFVPSYSSSIDPRVFIYDLAPCPDGSVLVAGTSPWRVENSWSWPGFPLVARLLPNGAEDPAFRAHANSLMEMRHREFRRVRTLGNGKILVAGNLPDQAVWRLLADGTPDSAYRANVQGHPGRVEVVSLEPDGKVVASGAFSTCAGLPRAGIARVFTTGSLDLAFQPVLPAGERAVAHARDPNGDYIVATGREQYLRGRLVRLNPVGVPDQSFAPAIKAGNELGCLRCVAVQPDRRILVAGSFDTVNGATSYGVARLNPDGSIDPSFALVGGAITAWGAGYVNVLQLQPDGKILVGGSFSAIAGAPRRSLARLLPNGAIDDSFVPVYLEGDEEDPEYPRTYEIKSVAQLGDGRLLAGFAKSVDPGPEPILLALNPDGTVDPTFYVGTGVLAANEVGDANAIAVQPDGKILVGGGFDSYDGYANPNLVRLLPDGHVDPSFEVIWGTEEQGIQPWEIGEVQALALQPDQKVVVGGWFKYIEGRPRWGLARLLLEKAPPVAPEITSQPTDQQVPLGGTATFTVGASGTQPLSFQWRHNNVPIPGQTTATLRLSGVAEYDAGDYSVLVTNPAGSALSDTASLTVLPMQVVLPAPQDQQFPAVASDGAEFMLVWLDRRAHANEAWTASDVYAARVSADGRVLDPDGFLVASNAMWASAPAIAFDGANFLVVWHEYTVDRMYPIKGSRISKSGVPLDGPRGFQIGADTGLLQDSPRVAFNGSVYLVTWTDWRNQTSGPDNPISDIYGARVTPSGTVLDPDNIPIVRAPYWQTSPAVAALGQQFVVVWEDMQGIRGATVDNAGAVSSPFQVSSGIRGMAQRPALSALGDKYLAAWEENFNVGNNTVWSWVAGTRLGAGGSSLDGAGFGIRTNANGYCQSLDIAAAPEAWWLVWHDALAYGTNSAIYAARVSPGREVSPAIKVNGLPVPHEQPAIGCNGSVLLAAWSDVRNASGQYPWERFGDIFATIIRLDGTVTSTNGFLVSSIGLQKPVVRWSNPADITYGTGLSSAQFNATAAVPGTFTYRPSAGTLLHAGANQLLSCVFVPSDLQRYTRATNQVRINVLPAPLTIRAEDKVKLAGLPNPPLTVRYDGFVAGDTMAVLDATPVLTTTATTMSPPGRYPIVASGASDADYEIQHVNGTLLVVPAIGPGNTDLTFDPTRGGGLIGVEGDHAWINKLALQPDGKLLVVGSLIGANGVPRRDLVRLNLDGSTDESFKGSIGGFRQVTSVAVQGDGRILIGGDFRQVNGVERPWIARLYGDGRLDETFTPTLAGTEHEVIGAIMVQRDGKILIGGNFTSVNGQPRYHVARLHRDGNVDLAFYPAPLPPGDKSRFASLGLQPDGKVLVGHNTCDPKTALRRLNMDGTLDTGFGLGVPPGRWCIGVRQVEMAPGNQMYVLGEFGPWRYVARLNGDGSEDTRFRPPEFLTIVREMQVQADGKLLVLGRDLNSGTNSPDGLMRLHADGTVDETFAAEKEAIGYPNQPVTMLLRPDGRIVVGKDYQYYNLPDSKAVVQLLPDGRLDRSFGCRVHAPGGMVRVIESLPDGRTIIGGHFTRVNDTARVGLACLKPDGTLDRNFAPPAQKMEWVEAVARQADGKFLVSGYFQNMNPPFSENLVRLNADGSLDQTFKLPEGFSGVTSSMAVQRDGKIVIGGEFTMLDGPRHLARLNADGSLDRTFAQGSGVDGEEVLVENVVVTPDGKILIAGAIQWYNGERTAGVLRLNADGSRDRSFAANPQLVPWAWRVGLLPDHSLVVLSGRLLRLLPDGTVDETFVAPPTVSNFAIDPAGQLIVSGWFTELGDGIFAPGVLKLNLDGTVDPGFRCVVNRESWVGVVALDRGGQLLIGGDFREVNGIERDAIARLENEVSAPTHPADLNPRDWRVSAEESAGYAQAWREGVDWSAPNPIPIGYVTRGACLSQVPGYRWNGSGAPPMWWVEPVTPGALPGPDPMRDTVTRRVGKYYTPGHEVDVTLKVSTRSGTVAWAVEERVPEGWQVRSITADGHYDLRHRKVKWGPVFGTGVNTLRYELVAAAGEVRQVALAGTGSFDGRDVAVGGQTELRPAPRLQWNTTKIPGKSLLRIEGDGSDTYMVETSEDLVHWKVLTKGIGPKEIPVTVEAGVGQRFYRLRFVVE